MAIGGIDVSRNANILFGSPSNIIGGGDATSVFSNSNTQNVRTSLEVSAKGLKRELDRLNGFKTDLTPAQKNILAKNQAEISEIEASVSDSKGLSEQEIQRRAQLFQESYRILGKDFVDQEQDPRLKALTDKVDALLEPKLRGGQKNRLDRLRTLEENAYQATLDAPGNETAVRRLRNIQSQVRELTIPRLVQQLSVSEKREYDDLVDQVNTVAKTEFILPSRERVRAEQLQTSLSQVEAQLAAVGGPEIGPTPAQAARAYTGNI